MAYDTNNMPGFQPFYQAGTSSGGGAGDMAMQAMLKGILAKGGMSALKAFLPFLGPGALAFLPTLLGGLFNNNDPARERQKQIQQVFDPAALQKVSSDHLAALMQGPAYSNQLQTILAGQQGATSAMNAGLARSGANMTGIGAMSMAAPNLGAAQQRLGLVAGMQNDSNQWALDRARAYAGGMGQTTLPANHYATLFAGGLNSVGPFVSNRMGWAGQPKSMRTSLYG